MKNIHSCGPKAFQPEYRLLPDLLSSGTLKLGDRVQPPKLHLIALTLRRVHQVYVLVNRGEYPSVPVYDTSSDSHGGLPALQVNVSLETVVPILELLCCFAQNVYFAGEAETHRALRRVLLARPERLLNFKELL